MKKIFSIFAIWLVANAISFAELITYDYDTAGRLMSANYGSGKTTTYQYDVTGNLLRSANNLITDSDNDGMADSWETTYFGNLSRNGQGDFDGDGLSDLAEFLAGTLPNNPGSVLRMERTVTNNLVQTTVSWLSVSGKVYRVQYKNSLADPGWNDLAGDVTATGSSASKTDTTSTGQPQRFYRVEVVQ